MYLVNTTFAVEPRIHGQWLRIITENYVPLIESRGYRIVALSRVLSAEAVEHYTYSLLVEAEDIERYKELTGEIFAEYAAIAGPMFGSDVVWFTSLMKKME